MMLYNLNIYISHSLNRNLIVYISHSLNRTHIVSLLFTIGNC
jgi:hypothetical protein